jgi:hypothetical protein
MDYTAEDCTLDFNTLRVIQNAVFNRRGALCHPGGIFPDVVPDGVPHDFARYYRLPDDTVASIVDRWVSVVHAGPDYNFNETNPVGGITNTLDTLNSTGPFDNCVIQVANRVIATSRDELPSVWYGTGLAETLGYPEPDDIAVLTTWYDPLLGLPLRPGPPLDPYLYTASFVDKWGNETNPIPVFSIPLLTGILIPDNWVQVQVPTAALTPTGMDPADLAFINVWRIGANNTSLRLSNRFVPTVQGAYYESGDFGTTSTEGGYSTSHDNTPDAALPDVFATYSNNPPPRGLLVLIEHIGRLFGFGESDDQAVMQELGSPARLHFSRPFQYNSWGNTDDGIDDDGGFLDIDDNHYDKLLGAASTGSVLVLGRLSSVYTLFGNGFQTFRFDRRSDHGIASRRAICRHVNVCRYLGSDFYPYELGNADSVRIGRSVERYIDTLADVSRAICFSHDGRFFACIPQASIGTGKTFVLDDRNGAWSLMTEFDLNAAHSLEPPTGGRPMLMGAHQSGIIRQFMIPQPDSPHSLELEIRTDRIRPSPLGDECYFKSIKIDGEFTGGPLIVTLNCESKSKSYTVPAGGLRFLYIDSLPFSMTGEWIEVVITGLWQSGEIRRIELEAIPIRETANIMTG